MTREQQTREQRADVGTGVDPDREAERWARAALSHVGVAGDARMAELIESRGAVEVWETLRRSPRDDPWPSRARQLDVDQMIKAAGAIGARFLIPGDPQWPEQLTDLSHAAARQDRGAAPMGLWVRGPGNLRELTARSVAIVGSRASTSYGDWVAGDLAADLVNLTPPWTVVSGGAYGIDAAAHRGALAGRGSSVAVLAGGLDRLYPRGNADLLTHLSREYLLVSESPVGTAPHRSSFLARNRLIAALTCGTVVVEGGVRSGASNTATWAAALGRHVMAVPGPVTSTMSHTPHRLIRDNQASLITGAADVARLLQPLGTEPEPDLFGPSNWFDALEPRQRDIREVLPARGALAVGEISLSSGWSPRDCLVALAQLADLGLVIGEDDGRWRLLHPGQTGTQPKAR